MANISDISRDQWMLTGPLATKGFDWWWHSFTAVNAKTGKRRDFSLSFSPAIQDWHRTSR